MREPKISICSRCDMSYVDGPDGWKHGYNVCASPIKFTTVKVNRESLTAMGHHRSLETEEMHLCHPCAEELLAWMCPRKERTNG